MLVTITNRGDAEAASLHVLPQLWSRNTWSWSADGAPKPRSSSGDGATNGRHR